MLAIRATGGKVFRFAINTEDGKVHRFERKRQAVEWLRNRAVEELRQQAIVILRQLEPSQ